MAKQVPGKNGGTIKRREKGDPPEKGAGRPPGSKSFKTLLNEALERTTKTKKGNEIQIKELSVAQVIAILISPQTDDNTKIKVFQMVRDTIGEAPAAKSEVTGKDGGAIEVKNLTINLPDDGGE